MNTAATGRRIEQAIGPHRSVLEAAPPLATVIKAEVAKQRPRRPAPASKA